MFDALERKRVTFKEANACARGKRESDGNVKKNISKGGLMGRETKAA